MQLIACNVVRSIHPFFKEVRETKTHSACLLISTWRVTNAAKRVQRKDITLMMMGMPSRQLAQHITFTPFTRLGISTFYSIYFTGFVMVVDSEDYRPRMCPFTGGISHQQDRCSKLQWVVFGSLSSAQISITTIHLYISPRSPLLVFTILTTLCTCWKTQSNWIHWWMWI